MHLEVTFVPEVNMFLLGLFKTDTSDCIVGLCEGPRRQAKGNTGGFSKKKTRFLFK